MLLHLSFTITEGFLEVRKRPVNCEQVVFCYMKRKLIKECADTIHSLLPLTIVKCTHLPELAYLSLLSMSRSRTEGSTRHTIFMIQGFHFYTLLLSHVPPPSSVIVCKFTKPPLRRLDRDINQVSRSRRRGGSRCLYYIIYVL